MKNRNIVTTLLLSFAILQLYAQKAPLPAFKHKFIVVAHRGDHVEAPENTIAAFENGIKHGVDYVEIDLRTSKDSVLVIMHDATVDRMTNGKGKISDLTYSQIRRLKIRSKSDSSKTYRVPSFEEVLKTCRNKIHIYLDFKDASVMQSYAMIKKYEMEKEIIVYINSEEQYHQWRSLVPTMPVMLSLPDEVKTTDGLKDFLAKYPLELLDGDYDGYTKDMLKLANYLGIAAWPDIQSPDESKNWDKAIETGFQGLQTDHPEALIHYLESKGLR